MRYRLRTLLIVAALGPPVLAGTLLTAAWIVEAYRIRRGPIPAPYRALIIVPDSPNPLDRETASPGEN